MSVQPNTKIWLAVAGVYLIGLFVFRIAENDGLDAGVVLDVLFAPLTLVLLVVGLVVAIRDSRAS